MMRAQEIISNIPWPVDIDDTDRQAVEDAIRALDARAYGNGRPTIGPMGAYRRIEDFVTKCGSASAAADELGISKGFLSQIRNSTRPAPETALRQLGLCRAPRGREVDLEL